MGSTKRGAEQAPLTALEAHVLAVLAQGDLHGYGIAKKIQERGGPSVYPANLYRHLHALSERGLIRAQAPEVDANGRARRSFSVTEQGLDALRRETARLRHFVEQLEQIQAVSPGTDR